MILLFDLNGTLTDPTPIGEPWHAPDLGESALASAVHSAAVDALTKVYRPFAEHMRAGIEAQIHRRDLERSQLDEAVERASALPARADADAALAALGKPDRRLAVLTNSGAGSGRRTLETAGLIHHFEAILGVDAVRTYKPHPDTYRYALEQLGAPADEVMLVAAHQWDVTGAKRAGLRAAWIARNNQPLSATAEHPDVKASNLADLARRLG